MSYSEGDWSVVAWGAGDTAPDVEQECRNTFPEKAVRTIQTSLLRATGIGERTPYAGGTAPTGRAEQGKFAHLGARPPITVGSMQPALMNFQGSHGGRGWV